MKVLYIMPWFRRPSAMSKHCGIFVDNVKETGLEPIIVSLKGSAHSVGYNIIDIRDKSNKHIAAVMRRIFPDIVNQPDVYNWGTRKAAVKTIEESIDMNSIDVIHSVSFPCSSHLIGYDLAGKNHKPWIAQFYDPWSDNPYRKFKTEKYRKKDLQMEKLVAEHANAIIHTNEVIKDVWSERYGSKVEKKMTVMPMSYESELYQKAEVFQPKKRQGKFVISYIGKLFFDRNLKDVVEAMTVVRSKGIDIEDKLTIRIIGEIHQEDINRIKEAGMDRVFEIIGYLPQNQLEKYYLESDAFLVIDSPQVQNVFFPSKLLDYFIYKRLIIGITPEKGVTHDLLKDSGNPVFNNSDISGIAECLRIICDNRATLATFDDNYYTHFSPEKMMNVYEKVLASITTLRVS